MENCVAYVTYYDAIIYTAIGFPCGKSVYGCVKMVVERTSIIVPDFSKFGISGNFGKIVFEELEKKDSGFELVMAEPIEFSDTSFKIRLDKSVRRRDVYVFMAPPFSQNFTASDQVMLTAQMLDACRRARTSWRILMETYNPWYAQDKRDTGYKESITGKVVADCYKAAGVSHVFYFEPHSPTVQSWYDSFDPIYMAPFLAGKIAEEFELSNAIVGIPDDGSVGRARHFADALGIGLVKIGKIRPKGAHERAEALPVMEDLNGKTVFLYDDMARTGGTGERGSIAAKQRNAGKIVYVVTHLAMRDSSCVCFQCDAIDHIRGTNTLPLHPVHSKLETYDIASFAANIIYRDSHGIDVSAYIKSLSPSQK